MEALPATFSGKIEIHKIKKEELDLLNRMVKRQFPEKTKYFSNGRMISVTTEDGPEEVPSEYYYRSSPYRQIISLGGYLFSIIRERIMSEKSEYRKSTSRAVNLPGTHLTLQPGRSFQVVFISEPSSAWDKQNSMKQPLRESEIKKILDGLMLLNINEQIYVFKKEYLESYNWDSDELARLTRSFLFNNLNGVFFGLDSLSSTFDAVEELYYKRPIYDFFAELSELFPGTRTNAEIRFYLASTLDFEQRTLKRLLESAGEIEDVMSGRKKPASVFQPEIKAFVVKQVYQDFYRLSKKLHISIDEIWDWYLRRQEQFYAELTEYGGQTRNRALYNWGRLLWTTGQHKQAIKKWDCLDPCFPIPSPSFWWVKDLLDRYGLNKYTKKAIDEKLMLENNSYKEELLERHLKFHTWQKRSEKSSGN